MHSSSRRCLLACEMLGRGTGGECQCARHARYSSTCTPPSIISLLEIPPRQASKTLLLVVYSSPARCC